nr:hypothetical protein [Tanacetum cinerariifolium]
MPISTRKLAKGFSDRFSLESSGTSDTHRHTRSTSKSQKTPSKNKEPAHLKRSKRLEDRSTTKEKTKRERSKSRGKSSRHQEISLDCEHEEGSEDAYEDLNSPYKKVKPTPFTQRITRFKYHRRAKLSRNIRVYEGNKDPDDHLGIFSVTAKQEEWLMHVWCKMFCQTLGGAARNWFDDLDHKSVDIFEELNQKFSEEFSQQKRYAKDPTEIHGIKRRQNEGLQDFMDRFKSESSHIKGVPPVLRISAFMHGHGHLKLAKKLNDKIPKTVDELFKRVRAFIMGEVAVGSTEMVRPSQGDKGYVRSAWSKVPEKAKNRGAQEKHEGIWGYTLLILEKILSPHLSRLQKRSSPWKQIKEAVGSGKLAHLVNDIRRNNQRNGNQERNDIKVINMIREEGNHKRPFDEGGSGLMSELTFSAIPRSQFTDEPIILEGVIEGNQVRVILVDGGSSSEIMYEHCFRNLDVNIRSRLRRCKALMIGRTEMRSLRAVGSTIHSMIKFPTDPGVVTVEASRETLRECKHLERLLADILRENIEVFAWDGSESTTVSRFVMEHQLKMYPLAEPVVHKKRPVAPEGRLALKERVFCWLGEGLIRKRMVEKVLADQRGQNVEIHLEEVVIKGKSKQNLIQNFKETLRKLKRVNIKIDLIMSSFRVNEGKFLGHMPAELKHLIREARTRMETIKESGWTNEAEVALQRIKNTCFLCEPTTTRNGDMIHPNEKRVQELIHTTRSLRTIFIKYKVKVVIDGPMEEILKLFGKEGRLAKWAAEVHTYDISYIPRKEAEGSIMRKFFGQGEQVKRTPDANEEGTLTHKQEASSKINPNTKGLAVVFRQRNN